MAIRGSAAATVARRIIGVSGVGVDVDRVADAPASRGPPAIELESARLLDVF